MKRRELLLGLVVLSAFAIMVFMAAKIGAFTNWRSQRLQLAFDRVNGLVPGAPVMVAGVKVGTVETIALKNGRPLVAVRVTPELHPVEGTTAKIRQKSLLGDKAVELIVPTDPSAHPLDATSLIPGVANVEIDDLFAIGAATLKTVDPERIMELVQSLDRLANDFGRLMKETNDHPELMTDLSALVASLRRSAEQLPDTMNHINKISTDLEPLLKKANTIELEDIRRLMREEGVLVRLKEKRIDGMNRE